VRSHSEGIHGRWFDDGWPFWGHRDVFHGPARIAFDLNFDKVRTGVGQPSGSKQLPHPQHTDHARVNKVLFPAVGISLRPPLSATATFCSHASPVRIHAARGLRLVRIFTDCGIGYAPSGNFTFFMPRATFFISFIASSVSRRVRRRPASSEEASFRRVSPNSTCGTFS